MKKRYKLVIFLCLISGGMLGAQTVADEMDALLGAQEVSCVQATRFVLAGAGVLPDDTDSGTAFNTALANKWLPKKASADEPVKMGELSLLIMRAFKLKGGLMYTILPSRRYAYREMVYQKLYQGNVDPSLTVSGERFLTILAKVLTYTKADEFVADVQGGNAE
jgi:hypothetical protein